MTLPPGETLLHASCVAIRGVAVLIFGASGSGKSDLALRLMDRGAVLVADDYTIVRREEDRLFASAPERIAGQIEVRGIGIVAADHAGDIMVSLIVDLDAPVQRLPDAEVRKIAGLDVPAIALAGFEASAPIKVALALARVLDEDRA